MSKKVRDLTPTQVIAEEDALLDFQGAVISALNDQNMTQSELADLLGISRGRMSQILSSEANPTLKLVGRIVAALGLQTRYVSKMSERPTLQFFPELDIASLNIGNEIWPAEKISAGNWASSPRRIAGAQWHINDNKREPNGSSRARAFAA